MLKTSAGGSITDGKFADSAIRPAATATWQLVDSPSGDHYSGANSFCGAHSQLVHRISVGAVDEINKNQILKARGLHSTSSQLAQGTHLKILWGQTVAVVNGNRSVPN